MSTALTVIIALLVFGFLIFIHEFGHYITARIFKVTITEFSIGMGPKLAWYDSKKTGIRYSLAMFPIGGFVAMVGENEDSDDPNAFDKKPAWQRYIITLAGAFVNIVMGALAMIIIVMMMNVGDTTVRTHISEQAYMDAYEDTEKFSFEGVNTEQKLRIGDVITRVNGKKVAILDELNYQIMRYGNESVDLTVIRDGEEIVIEDVVFPRIIEQNQEFGTLNIGVYKIEKGFFNTIGIAMRKSFLTLRMCWESILDLIRGRYSFAAVSGPVGISGAIGDAASQGFASLLNIVVLISINLGFMNLLPIPALDGGRLLTIFIEMVSGKKLPTKVEGMINAVGLCALLLLSVVIMIKDVVQLF